MLTVINPATEEVLRELEEDDGNSVQQKTAAARGAQPGWAATPLADRLRAVRDFGVLLANRRDALAELLTSEMGKPIRQAKSELTAMQGRIDFFLEHTASAVAEETLVQAGAPSGVGEQISYEPLGLVANISAWN